MRYMVLLAALPLVACNQETTTGSAALTGEVSLTNASVSEVAKQTAAAGATKLQPGEWETRVVVSDIAIPGMPAAMAEQMKTTMAKQASTTVKNCVTPEEAKRPMGKVFGGGGGECRYRRFTMSGGRIDGVLECGAAGANMTMTTTGTFTPDSFTLKNDMKMDGGPTAGAGGMSMKADVSGRRIGACKA